MSDLTEDLASPDAATVCRALADIRTRKRIDDATLDAVAALLTDSRIHTEQASYGPTYKPICEEAIAALVAAGPRALPTLERACTIEHEVTVSEPSYDQGVYIGDYSSRTLVLADAALEGIRTIGKSHHGAVAWVAMTRRDWDRAKDVVTMLKAAFEQTSAHLPDHVRRFLVACARQAPVVDPELAAAMAIAEQIAFTYVARDVMTAARAAVRYPPSPIARVVELALAPELRLEDALEATALLGASATPNRLRAGVPFQTTEPVNAPPLASQIGSWTPLLDAVCANLDDDAPRLAFARWLTKRRDPRGEFIAVQCELARTPSPAPDVTRFDALRKRDRELSAEHTDAWTRFPRCVIFERGFAERAFSTTSVGDGTLAALRGEPTLREIKMMGGVSAGWVDALAHTQQATQLRRLRFVDARLGSFEIETLVASPYFDNLRELEISNCHIDMKLVDMLADWRGIRRVERLVLTGNRLPEEARAHFAHRTSIRELLL